MLFIIMKTCNIYINQEEENRGKNKIVFLWVSQLSPPLSLNTAMVSLCYFPKHFLVPMFYLMTDTFNEGIRQWILLQDDTLPFSLSRVHKKCQVVSCTEKPKSIILYDKDDVRSVSQLTPSPLLTSTVLWQSPICLERIPKAFHFPLGSSISAYLSSYLH